MKPQKSASKLPTIISAVVAWGLLFGYGGYYFYQKQQDGRLADTRGAATQSNTSQASLPRTGGTGKVTAISGSSISFYNQRESKEQTFAIADSTRITEEGEDRSHKDIKAGTMVLIWTRGADTKTANLIVINPNMDGSARP